MFAIFLLGNSFIYSQKNRADSLKNYFDEIEKLVNNKQNFINTPLVKENITKDKKGVKALLNLYTFYKYKKNSSAVKYNNEALSLSKKIGFEKGKLQANYNSAYLLFVNGSFNNSIKLLNKINVPKSYKNIFSDVNCLKSLIHTERGEYDIALELALKLLEIGENDKNDYVLMKAHGALLHYYLRTENYEKALNHCLKGLNYTIKIKEIQYLYFKIDEIARILAKLGHNSEALKVYDFYLNLEKIKVPPGDYIQSIVYMNMADICTSNKQLKRAQGYISKALELNRKNNFRFRIPRAQILQAALFLKTKDTINAIKYYERSLNSAEEINAFDVVKSVSKTLGDVYKTNNQPLKSFEYIALHKAIKDSLFSNEKEQKIIILEAKQKIKEINHKQKILKIENHTQKIKLQSIAFALLCLVIVSLFIAFSYIKVRNKNKLLYQRTIELARIQFEMNNKITKLENSELDSNNKTTSIIADNVKNIILKKLNLLENEHFFLNQNCTLRKIAEQLKTNPKYLSQVINLEKKSNFNNYINELRINHLLAKLLKDKQFRENKLSYIAVSVGYNNLNTFNAAFKKRQGILPSYFIKKLIEEEV